MLASSSSRPPAFDHIIHTRPSTLFPHIQNPKETATFHISSLSRALTLPEEEHIVINHRNAMTGVAFRTGCGYGDGSLRVGSGNGAPL
jgi:hypothetical protein